MDPSAELGPPSRQARLHYLDWLRVAALLGVFAFHALHPFDFFDWHVKNDERSLAITLVLFFLFPWGLGFFFLVAGAASRFALRDRTAREYVRERVARLLVPFLVGSALLGPLQGYIESVHEGSWTRSFAAFLPHYVRDVAERLADHGLNPHVFGTLGYHLWFLGFLFSFALIGLPVFRLLDRRPGRRAVARMARVADRRGALLLLAVPIALPHVALRGAFPEEHDWGEFVYYLAFFLCGYVVFAEPRLMAGVRRDVPVALVAGVLAFGATLAIGPAAWERWITEAGYSLGQVLMTALFSAYAWAWVVVALGLGVRVGRFRRPLPRRLGELSLPFFVLHQPVILAIAFFVVGTGAGIPLKLAVVASGALLVTVALSELIRRMGPLRALFGVPARHRAPGHPAGEEGVGPGGRPAGARSVGHPDQ